MKRAPTERVLSCMPHGEKTQNAASANAVPFCRVMTMRLMTQFAFLLLALLAFNVSAGAQQTSDDPYEFILAKLAADDGRFDEALSRIDKIVAKNPQNAVVLYERALILIDASKIDAAETELREFGTLQHHFC